MLKIPVLLLILSTHLYSLHAQVWETQLSVYGIDRGFDIIESPDKGFITLGAYANDPRSKFLLKQDSAGVTEWVRLFEQDDDQGIDGLINLMGTLTPLSEETFIAPVEFVDEGYDFGYVVFDLQGEIISNTHFSIVGNQRLRTVIPLADGSVFMAGNQLNSTGDNDFFCLKVDAQNNLEWASAFGSPDEGNDVLITAILTDDGGFALAGSFSVEGVANRIILKLSENGQEEWRYNEEPMTPSDGFRALIQKDSLFFFTSSSHNYNGAININTQEIVWENWPFPYHPSRATWDMIVVEDGLVSTGAYTNDLFLMKTDFSGEVQWFKLYGSCEENGSQEVREEGWAVRHTSDGGYIITGSRTNSPGNPSFLYTIKTDSLGNTVLPSHTGEVLGSICDGDVRFSYNGENYYSPGIYYDLLEHSGTVCDTLMKIIVAEGSPSESYLNESICAGDAIIFQGDTITTAGLYQYIVGDNIEGCDSTVNLFITELPNATISQDVQLCFGEVLEVNGLLFDTSGEYLIALPGENQYGCDSALMLNLTITEALEIEGVEVVDDPGDMSGAIFPGFSGGLPPYSYLWNTGDTTASLIGLAPGTYQLTVTDANGCSFEFEFMVDLINNTNSISQDEQPLLFPNPIGMGNQLFVETGVDDLIFRLYDVQGRLIMNQKMGNETRSVTLPTIITSGVYHAVFVTNAGVFVEKLVVQ